MSCADALLVGGPVVEVDAKRSFDEIAIPFDWHDYIARLPERGRAYSQGTKVRLPRSRSKGFQYEVTTGGVTGNQEPRWPEALNATVTDGSVVWTAKAIDANSLRTTISSNQAPAVSGITVGAVSVDDHVYSVLVSGGTSGTTYDIKHQVVLANGEDKEAVARIKVQD
jgi:hypothetical protein